MGREVLGPFEWMKGYGGMRIEGVAIRLSCGLLALACGLAVSSLRAAEGLNIPFQAYAQVGAVYTTNGKSVNPENEAGTLYGYSAGSLDLFFNPRLDDHVKTLFEVNLEHNADGVLETMLERVQLGYAFEDATLWIGRFHSPYGFWNTGYHHGAQLQTALRRPRFLDFDDHGAGVLPSHTVGLWFSGGVNPGKGGRLTYDVYTGNGSDVNMHEGNGRLDSNNYMDRNKDKVFGASVAYNFSGRLNGLRAGLHALQSEVSYADMDMTPPDESSRTKVRMYGAFAYYEDEWCETIAELYRFEDRNLYGSDDLSHQSRAGFVQVALRASKDLTPYLRLEEAVLDRQDDFFGKQSNGYGYRRQVLGLRYDLNMNSAVKIEWDKTRSLDPGLGRYDETLFQYAVRF